MSNERGAKVTDFQLPIESFAEQYGMYILFNALEGELFNIHNKEQTLKRVELEYAYHIGIRKYIQYMREVDLLNTEMNSKIIVPRLVNIFNQRYGVPQIYETDIHLSLAKYAERIGKLAGLPYVLDKKFLYLYNENILQKYKNICKYIWK